MVRERVGMVDRISTYDPHPLLRAFFLNIPLLNPIAITWHLDQVNWVEMWFIIKPKLSILKNLVCEQLKLGHIQLSASRHNTLTFNTKKCMDCINCCKTSGQLMIKMKNGTITDKYPSTIPHHTTILDTKDFFQIPLTAHYKDCFAFMAWKCNLHRLAQRFQWMALPPKIKKKK